MVHGDHVKTVCQQFGYGIRRVYGYVSQTLYYMLGDGCSRQSRPGRKAVVIPSLAIGSYRPHYVLQIKRWFVRDRRCSMTYHGERSVMKTTAELTFYYCNRRSEGVAA